MINGTVAKLSSCNSPVIATKMPDLLRVIAKPVRTLVVAIRPPFLTHLFVGRGHDPALQRVRM